MRKTAAILIFSIMVSSALHAEKTPRRVFQLELYGGLTSLNPSDLNLAILTEEDLSYYYLNQYYDYLLYIGYIDSYTEAMSGEYGRLKQALPFGFRFKANITPALAVSLGFKYINKTKRSSPRHEFTVIENSGATSLDRLEYSPIQVSLRGVSLHAGVHLGFDIGRLCRLEGFVSGGPVYGECEFSYDQNHYWRYGDSGVEIEVPFYQKLKGDGRGTAVDVGFQVSRKLMERVHISLEGSYSYQVVKKLHGVFEQDAFGFLEGWEGDIGLLDLPYWEPWETRDFTFLDNNWDAWGDLIGRNMRLDMSGFSLSIGIIFKI